MQGRLDFMAAGSSIAGSHGAFAAFDPQGLVFAVATGSKFIRLYDARNWERGAFTTFQLSNSSDSQGVTTGKWTNLQFSPDGKEIFIGTSDVGTTAGIILDSFDGNVKGTIESIGFGMGNIDNDDISTSQYQYHYTSPPIYTPDSKFLIGARSDGVLNVWSGEKLTAVECVEGISREPIKALAFNPKYAMLATATNEGTIFYI